MKLVFKVNDLIFLIMFVTMTIYTMAPMTITGILFLVLLLLYILNSIKNKENFLACIMFILIFQMVSKNYTTGIIYIQFFQYLDEFLTICFLGYIIMNVVNKKVAINKYEKRIIFCYLIFLLISLISNIYYQMQSIFPIVIDIITCSKFIIMYFFAKIYYTNNLKEKDIFEDSLTFKCKAVAVILMILAILNIIIPSLYDRFDYRYITESLQLFFPHPTYLAASSLLMLIILLASKSKGNTKYVLMLSFITLITFRIKAIVSLLSILLIYVGYYKFKIRSKIIWLLAILIMGLSISYDQIQKYYFNNSVDTIRDIMTEDGIELANEYFPLGTGFATFGSTAAYQFESQIYYKLGYFTKYADQPLADVFWPIVLAQSGWIGTMFFGITIMYFIIYILKSSKTNPKLFVCALSIFIYEIITSTAETALFNPTVSGFFIVLGLIISKSDEEGEENFG